MMSVMSPLCTLAAALLAQVKEGHSGRVHQTQLVIRQCTKGRQLHSALFGLVGNMSSVFCNSCTLDPGTDN